MVLWKQITFDLLLPGEMDQLHTFQCDKINDTSLGTSVDLTPLGKLLTYWIFMIIGNHPATDEDEELIGVEANWENIDIFLEIWDSQLEVIQLAQGGNPLDCLKDVSYLAEKELQCKKIWWADMDKTGRRCQASGRWEKPLAMAIAQTWNIESIFCSIVGSI